MTGFFPYTHRPDGHNPPRFELEEALHRVLGDHLGNLTESQRLRLQMACHEGFLFTVHPDPNVAATWAQVCAAVGWPYACLSPLGKRTTATLTYQGDRESMSEATFEKAVRATRQAITDKLYPNPRKRPRTSKGWASR